MLQLQISLKIEEEEKGVSPNFKSQVKSMCNQICNAQQAPSLQPLPFEHVHSKEANILAISELAHALDKKVLPAVSFSSSCKISIKVKMSR
nr:uncharacterized protein LOC112751723 isoform X1 [Arachis hypogaea]